MNDKDLHIISSQREKLGDCMKKKANGSMKKYTNTRQEGGGPNMVWLFAVRENYKLWGYELFVEKPYLVLTIIYL